MKISTLFEQHEKFKNQGLKQSFGDGYLVAHNTIYQKVRATALQQGYSFSCERNEAYETFPLLQLEKILKTKVFPYVNNAITFEQMDSATLALLNFEDIDGNLKKNHVFHESCHGIARTLSEKYLGKNIKTESSTKKDLDGERQKSLRMLIEESAANTYEFIGISEAHDQTHRLFYQMNSYFCDFENKTHLKNAINDVGLDVIIKFMFLSYLQSNFLKDQIEDKQFQQMIALSTNETLDPKRTKALRALSKTAFQLNERFRVQTTSFHLRLLGIHTPIRQLFDFDFLKALKSDSGFESFLKALSHL